ncbi:hypothetical protein BD408DRAFT_414265 [Parasitella parasitica]|nr:hypothetical protein BD408DRAFT_414265 [Parasitella parasitica]
MANPMVLALGNFELFFEFGFRCCFGLVVALVVRVLIKCEAKNLNQNPIRVILKQVMRTASSIHYS